LVPREKPCCHCHSFSPGQRHQEAMSSIHLSWIPLTESRSLPFSTETIFLSSKWDHASPLPPPITYIATSYFSKNPMLYYLVTL
jgi:hypothetical protein